MQNSAECFMVGIKALRDHGWQQREQKEIAKDIGYTTTHISQVFQGKRTAGAKLQDALAIEYGVHVENVIKIGRMILDEQGFFPFFGQIEHLTPNSEEQAAEIVRLTNKSFGLDDLRILASYQPEGWEDFVSGNISTIEFYQRYSRELNTIIQTILARR